MLTARQLLILETIIQYVTLEGEAVGSKTIVSHASINASSATVRSDMSVLEREGYITKTHSSSGRLPSLKGYRFYLDHMMTPEALSPAMIHQINQRLNTQVRRLDELVNQSARMLADLTNYTTIVLGPTAQTSYLTAIQLISINQNQLMILCQIDHQSIESIVIQTADVVTASELDKLNSLLQTTLVGHTLDHVLQMITTEILERITRDLVQAEQLRTRLRKSLLHRQQQRVHISGRTHLLDFSDQLNKTQMKKLFRLLDGETSRLKCMLYSRSDDIEVTIGPELGDDVFEQLSLVTATYHVSGIGQGMITLLGPTNMPYSKTLGVVEAFRQELADAVLNYYDT